MGNLKKALFIFIGTVSLGLGIVGVIVPGLPTTVFLLITAYFYARSSQRLYDKLLNHKLLGGYIKDFQKGMSVRTKIRAITMMWTMILISAFVFIDKTHVRLILIGVGIIGMVSMMLAPGRKEE